MYVSSSYEEFSLSSSSAHSRFSGMFSNTESVDPLSSQAMLFFNVRMPNFKHITESSTEEEIKKALDLCGSEISRLNSEVSSSVSGQDFLSVKCVQKSFISEFIRLLLLLKSKSNSTS